MQNQDFLHGTDASNLVFMVHLKNSYFTSYSTTEIQKVSFELELLNIYKTLKGLSKLIKRVTIQIKFEK